ncbi:MAG: GNAT family N-acetyltransferase [Chloroflexales bacterium]|nr:GNAT family N-acetyltransferase [Chloroflexales bacterium]
MTQTQSIAAPYTTTLRDGRAVTIRPLAEEDRQALHNFGMALPENDLLYLEDDFQNQDIISRLINAHAAENWRQVVALDNNHIVAYGAVRQLPGWFSHVGDIQLVVSDAWRRSGLGTAMAWKIVGSARDLGVKKIIVEMTEKQTAGQAIFQRLGFNVEGNLQKHACDRSGHLHNLLLLSYHIEE